MFAASKTAAVSGAAPDAQFNYVTMLLHGDGTNGAQNNTFVDSSSNNFTITRNGNTTQGSFSPYGSNWSNYFGGSGNYLSVANNTALQMSTGDFTVEFWLNFSSLSNYQTIFEKGYVNAGGLLVQTNTGTGTLIVYASGSAVITASSASTLGAWNHYALVRNSGTLTLYKDGVSVGSVSNSTNFNNSADPFFVGGSTNGSGYYFVGNMSNFRVVKGTAVYTGSFTPSTTPLTAITNTSLLTCQSNRFIDNSSNAFALTVGGTPSVQRFNPFGASTSYSTSVIGGSGYFDGTGDYLSANCGRITSDFTVEGWAFFSSAAANKALCTVSALSSPSYGLVIYTDGTNWRLYVGATSWAISGESIGSFSPNSWSHIAVTRSGSTVRGFVNGVLGFTGTFSGSIGESSSATYTFIGEYSDWIPTGYISNFRMIFGSAVYTSSFTPPTAPLTAITNTKLLLDMTNGAIYDNAMMNDGLTVNNAQIDTSIKKFGTGSMKFVRDSYSNGDFLSFPKSPNYDLSGGPFTIEAWVYPTLFDGQYQTIVSRTPTIWKFGFLDNQLIWYNGATTVTSTGTVSVNAWTHVAVTGDGTTVRLFINGTLDSSFTGVNPQSGLGTLNVGAPANGTYGGRYAGEFYTGYIDDLRITKGYARYTANFTPPTAALSDKGPI